MAKNKFKFCCADCQKTHYLNRQKLNNRTRPRCPYCGSVALDEVTDRAKERRLSGETKRLIDIDRRKEISNNLDLVD